MTEQDIEKIQTTEFKAWVSDLKREIRAAQLKTMQTVNADLLHLYWRLGSEIVEKEKQKQWGDGFLKRLSEELGAEFANIKGFSYRNMRYIKQWYLLYNQSNTIWQQPVAKLGEEFFCIPWGHHLYIMSKCGGNMQKYVAIYLGY